MNTFITLSLDKRRAKKDGTFPLVLRISHNSNTTAIPTGISLLEKDWNEKDRKIKNTYMGSSSVTRLNNLLQKKKADAMDVIFKLHEGQALQTLSVTDLRNKIAKENTKASFFDFTDELVKSLEAAGKIGTARSYKGTASVLRTFNGGKDLPFAQITYSYLKRFENNHIGKGHSYNGLSVYIRAIRAIYNKAILAGAAEKEFYPFDEYKIKEVPTVKRALDADKLVKIIETNLEPGHPLFDTRNFFIASYLMYGMSYIDMAFLEKDMIVEGRVNYRRKKSAKVYDIKITPHLEKILNYYIELNPESSYVFPIIKEDTLKAQYKKIQEARKIYNKKLRKLADLCGIQQHLTSYVSRHSFATQLLMKDVPLKAISTMLGHSRVTTTEIYLKDLPTSRLDEFNSQIIPMSSEKPE